MKKNKVLAIFFETCLLLYIIIIWIFSRKLGFLFSVYQTTNIIFYIFILLTGVPFYIFYIIEKIQEIIRYRNNKHFIFLPFLSFQIIFTSVLFLATVFIPYFYIAFPIWITIKIFISFIFLIIFNIIINISLLLI